MKRKEYYGFKILRPGRHPSFMQSYTWPPAKRWTEGMSDVVLCNIGYHLTLPTFRALNYWVQAGGGSEIWWAKGDPNYPSKHGEDEDKAVYGRAKLVKRLARRQRLKNDLYWESYTTFAR